MSKAKHLLIIQTRDKLRKITRSALERAREGKFYQGWNQQTSTGYFSGAGKGRER